MLAALFSQFPTPEAVLEGACYMVALQIAREPLVRQVLRQTFQERAKINVTPTKKGKKVKGATEHAITQEKGSHCGWLDIVSYRRWISDSPTGSRASPGNLTSRYQVLEGGRPLCPHALLMNTMGII